MRERAGRLRTLVPVLALVLAPVAAGSGRAADCFAPIARSDKWTCSAKRATGETVAYCLNLVRTTGEGAERTFDMVATGPFPRRCTCGAKGAGPKARHNAAATFLCFDETTATAERGAITRKRMAGQLYDARRHVSGTFQCRPEPACVVALP